MKPLGKGGRSCGVCGAGSSLDLGCQTMGKFNFRQQEQNTEWLGEVGSAEGIKPAETALWSRANSERKRRVGTQAHVCHCQANLRGL